MINKKFAAGLLLALGLSMTACSEEKTKPEEPAKQEESTDKKEETVKPDEDKQEEQEPEEKEPEEKKPEKSKVSVAIYKMSPKEEKIITETVEYDELNENDIWTSLMRAEVVGEETKILSLKQNDDKLEINVNKAFGEQLRSYGTAGEKALLHCVVNTYLDAYGCKEIKIMEENDILTSGHAEYEDYMTKFE